MSAVIQKIIEKASPNRHSLAVSLGQVVKNERARLGYTQEIFAERCGFFRTYMSRIETGQANMTLSALEVLAVALKLKSSDLLAKAESES